LLIWLAASNESQQRERKKMSLLTRLPLSLATSLRRPLHLAASPALYAGHSKWHNIRHKKAAEDAKRAQAFTKMSTEITAAARESGVDLSTNLRLAAAIARARQANMPKDNIERAIKRATGDKDGGSVYESILYEGHGPAGIAVMIQALTDNKHRTAPQVRHVLTKFGGSLGSSGSVAWMFDRKAVFSLEGASSKVKDFDTVLECALEHGADFCELYTDSDVIEVRGGVTDYARLFGALSRLHADFAGELAYIPQNTMAIEEGDPRTAVEEFLDKMEELDDVQSVFHNAEL
jgi:YebC/PmpR family DNA-binding regulatory protein